MATPMEVTEDEGNANAHLTIDDNGTVQSKSFSDYREFLPYANFITVNFVTAVFQNYYYNFANAVFMGYLFC